MANDRFYLICTGCSDYLLLAKGFGEPAEVRVTEAEMNAWFKEHHICGSRMFGSELSHIVGMSESGLGGQMSQAKQNIGKHLEKLFGQGDPEEKRDE